MSQKANSNEHEQVYTLWGLPRKAITLQGATRYLPGLSERQILKLTLPRLNDSTLNGGNIWFDEIDLIDKGRELYWLTHNLPRKPSQHEYFELIGFFYGVQEEPLGPEREHETHEERETRNTLFDIPAAKPPRPVLMLSGCEEPKKKKVQPDFMQFSFSSFLPKFGDARRGTGKKRRVSKQQLALI